MKKSRFLLSLAACLMLCMPTANGATPEYGEDNATTSYLFLGVQGGSQVTFSNYKFNKMLMPFGAVYFGGYFNPVIGGRLHAMGFRSKGGFSQLEKTYYYDYYTADADLLINLSNLFWKNDAHFVNLIFVGGVGLNYAWHNGDMNYLLVANPSLINQCPEAWKHNRLGHNFRLGLQLDFNICKHFGANIEIDANNLSDRFNSKKTNNNDWMATAAIGLTYKFAYKTKKVPQHPIVKEVISAPAPAPQTIVEKPAPVPTPVPKPAPVIKNLKENIFYSIRSSTVSKTEWNKVENVAKFMQENPDATVEIAGYADIKTGNPTINMKISNQRANDLKNILIKKYNIDSSRINVDAKGDTVQPFTENEQNRVSIITGFSKK